MAGKIDWEKHNRKKRKFEWVALTDAQKRVRAIRNRWNGATWRAERERVQALADAAAPKPTEFGIESAISPPAKRGTVGG